MKACGTGDVMWPSLKDTICYITITALEFTLNEMSGCCSILSRGET